MQKCNCRCINLSFHYTREQTSHVGLKRNFIKLVYNCSITKQNMKNCNLVQFFLGFSFLKRMCRICLYLILVSIPVFVFGQQQLGSNFSQVPVGDSDMVLIPAIAVVINKIRIASCNPLKLKDTVLEVVVVMNTLREASLCWYFWSR